LSDADDNMIMDNNLKKIIPYTDELGKQPITDWLDPLDRKIRTRITNRFSRIELGNLGDCSPVGDGVKELRFKFGSGYRIYFGEDGNDIIILLVGGDKNSQPKDIERAKYYWKDYQMKKVGV